MGIVVPNVIRPLTLDDAPEIERLYAQSAAHLRARGDVGPFLFNAEVFRRDGFGARPAFEGVVVAEPDRLAGYLLYTFGYDTDRALRYLFVIDLLVDEARRGQGLGRALMQAAMTVCRAHGGAELFWAVATVNAEALAFYTHLGAQPVSGLQYMTLSISESV